MGTVTIKETKETGLKGHLNAGLSSRGGGWGFSLATMNVAPGYFHRKIDFFKHARLTW